MDKPSKKDYYVRFTEKMGRERKEEKLFIQRVVRNTDNIISLIYTDKGPKYLSEVGVPIWVSEYWKFEEKQLKSKEGATK